MRCARSATKLAEDVCLRCCEYSHVYLSVDRRVGETAAPGGSVPLSYVRLVGSKRCVVEIAMCMGGRACGSLYRDRSR